MNIKKVKKKRLFIFYFFNNKFKSYFFKLNINLMSGYFFNIQESRSKLIKINYQV